MYRASAKSIEVQRPIPDKLFYKIGEVSRIADIEPYVLRYWETEFPFLKPRKNKSGQRVYVKKDLEFILEIKGFSIRKDIQSRVLEKDSVRGQQPVNKFQRLNPRRLKIFLPARF